MIEGIEMFAFNKPILHVNASGMLIVQKHGIETTTTILIIEDNPTYIVPYELLMHAGVLHIVLVSSLRKMYEANFHIDEKSIALFWTVFFAKKLCSIFLSPQFNTIFGSHGNNHHQWIAFDLCLLIATYFYHVLCSIFIVFYIIFKLCKGSL